MRRYLSLIFFTLTLVLGGFGCKGSAPTSATTAVKHVTLEMWTVNDDVDTINTLITQYTTARPYLTVNVRQLTAGEFYQRLIQALAVDQGPDIISINTRDLGTYLPMLQAMPSSYRDTTVATIKGQFSTTISVKNATVALPNTAQLANNFVQTVSNDVVRGSSIYGLPLSLDTMALFYNKDLLDQAGIAEPPKTWDDFQADVKKLTKFDKAGSIIQSGADLGTSNVVGSADLLYLLYRQSNLNFVDAGSGRAMFQSRPSNAGRDDETPSMQVMDFYTDFANPARDTYTWSNRLGDPLSAFVNGRLAFFFGYNYDQALIKARAPGLNVQVLPMLQLHSDQPVNVANYSMLSVAAKSSQPNEAWGVINYLTNSAAVKRYLDATERPAAVRQYVTAQQSDPVLAPFVSQILVTASWYHGSNYTAATQVVNQLIDGWQADPPDGTTLYAFKQSLLTRFAAQFNQSL